MSFQNNPALVLALRSCLRRIECRLPEFPNQDRLSTGCRLCATARSAKTIRIKVINHQLAVATEQKEVAHDAALHDVLTGLPNRALFTDRLEHAIAQTNRHGGKLAVMFVELDKFKTVNDTYGHEAGDIVLQTAAQRITENFRDEDTVSRHGGDEFLCLLTKIKDERNISMIAEKIISAIQVPFKLDVRGLEIRATIGASIGISIFPRQGTTAETLIKSADEAMYRAKKTKSGHSFAE